MCSAYYGGILLVPLLSLCGPTWGKLVLPSTPCRPRIGTKWVEMMQPKEVHHLDLMMMCFMKTFSSAHHACIGKVCDGKNWLLMSYKAKSNIFVKYTINTFAGIL